MDKQASHFLMGTIPQHNRLSKTWTQEKWRVQCKVPPIGGFVLLSFLPYNIHSAWFIFDNKDLDPGCQVFRRKIVDIWY